MPDLKIYNSLSRKKEIFKPIHPGFVGIYVCGPTVYGHAHLGHAKSYTSYDVIVRFLRYLNYKVRYVQNITDVGHLLGDANEGEDRILKQARIEKIEPMEVVERYMRSYFEDMDALNVLRPDISPRASAHIPEQIELVQTLLDKGYAYEVNGTVYFSVEKFKDYGKLSGRDVNELKSGVRINVHSDKRHPADFALWKKAEPEHLMQWNSPWGKGYPGWHAECSVMSTKYLGQPFDIHGGGIENIFPHHECEIAQSEAATGKEFAHYWIHNNMITVDGQKMGKSLSNFITIKDALKKYDPMAIRFFVLSSHYRSPLDFSESAREAGQKGLERFIEGYHRLRKASCVNLKPNGIYSQAINNYKQRFEEEMNDDFNSPKAIAALFDFLKETNSALDKNEMDQEMQSSALKIIDETAGNVLGLIKPGTTDVFGQADQKDIQSMVNLLIELRNKLRSEKNFNLADEIRKRLLEIGFELRDTASGTEWKKN
ncbi:MAG: cysteine--tRNA ligase [Calditrichaceae bacterium]|nr:cysteine--tRNA ligase [Calditrichaceae bacterium]RQV92688.1 MAG: cysteine--tRNA ligase [Calditrichota bacterium]